MIPLTPNNIPLPPSSVQPGAAKDPASDNVRDLVLKEPEHDKPIDNSKHYVPTPSTAKEKVDRDFDDLHRNNMLDLSELPVPAEDNSTSSQITVRPFGGFGGGVSSFQKTYQTFSFKNGVRCL